MYTQRRMNILHEGQDIEMPNRYATTTLLLMMSAFYVTLIPYLPIICLFGAIYQYCIEKWMFITRNRVPQRMGSFIDHGFRNLMTVITFLYGLGQFIFIGRLSKGKNRPVII